ncbi:hypothetical protein [Desulforamulus aquiferis]|uniref:CARD domain-containing protein n=1 Tax=Desulforamulus aquiferis TaxID=1397668 RepID=A0AAW7Z9F3_9FIRM|nr:hypothetical protein [Desulforamulus aquiferis]MDO7786010.1 hypothetical protein [Desulforamulus aquiferis]
MLTLLKEISKDREKLIAFIDYLVASGRLTEDEIIKIIRECEEKRNSVNK